MKVFAFESFWGVKFCALNEIGALSLMAAGHSNFVWPSDTDPLRQNLSKRHQTYFGAIGLYDIEKEYVAF